MQDPAIVNRIKIVPTRHCALRCPMCYWPVPTRESAEGLTTHECEMILDDARGFDEVHFFSGEAPGYFDRYIVPVLRKMEQLKYSVFVTTCSGILLEDADILRMLELFPGVIRFRLSIEGRWGHDNHCSGANNGDILARFLEMRDRFERLEVCATWTHLPSPKNDPLLSEFRNRCQKHRVPLTEAYASDLTSESPSWGPVVNPWRVGISSAIVDCDTFTNCAFPCRRHDQVIRQVQVDWSGTYYLCKCKVEAFRLGEIGTLRGASLLQVVNRFRKSKANLVASFEQDGILGVTRRLLNSDARGEVRQILDSDYPRNCGGCNICMRSQKFFPLMASR